MCPPNIFIYLCAHLPDSMLSRFLPMKQLNYVKVILGHLSNTALKAKNTCKTLVKITQLLLLYFLTVTA